MGIKERVKVSVICFFLGGMGREGFGERREGLQGEEGGGGGGGGIKSEGKLQEMGKSCFQRTGSSCEEALHLNTAVQMRTKNITLRV